MRIRTIVNLFAFVLALFCLYRWSSISQVTKEEAEFLGLVASGGYHGANEIDIKEHIQLVTTARRYGIAGLTALALSAIGVTLQWRRIRHLFADDS